MKKITTEEFIKRAKLIHNDNYNYSLVNYINSKTKVKIICSIHGAFEQTPSMHLSGQGCPCCGINKRKYKQSKSTEQFIKEAKEIHHNKYDYSKTVYVNSKTKVKIICPVHKTFEQNPSDHLNGSGCPFCGKSSKTTNIFIEQISEKYKDIYDCSNVKYISQYNKIKIKCNICDNYFIIAPKYLLNGDSGCPYCNKSKGERIIESFLKRNNIYYIPQKKFLDLRDKDLLSYDFYLPEKNLLIEYNGKQHYNKNSFCKEYKDYFIIQKHHDWLKRKYAKDNNYNLLTITYKDDNIEQILNERIN